MSYSDDRAAYRRLRARGLHPDRIVGCAELEATATRDSLGWGKGMTDDQQAVARTAMGDALALGGDA